VKIGGGLDADAIVVVLAVATCTETTCLEVGENVAYHLAKARGVELLEVCRVAEHLIVRVHRAPGQGALLVALKVFLEPASTASVASHGPEEEEEGEERRGGQTIG